MLMKDPADRFQCCEELVAAMHGQPTAAPGAVRISAAAAAVMAGGRISAPTVPSPVGGLPPIVSQPTTPLDSPLVNRRTTPRERRDVPRRVADRSRAMRSGSSSWAWLWLVVAVLGGMGGAYYYYESRGFAAGTSATTDSAPAGIATDTTPLRDTTAASTPAIPTPSDSAPSAAPEPAPPARPSAGPPVRSSDSGGIRVIGLPRGSAVMIDGNPATEAVTRLAPGPHALGVSAPRFNFYSDTIVVRSGEITEVGPELTPIGEPQPERRRAVRRDPCRPGPGYNADGSCFDERPKPVNPPFVPLPEGVDGTPRPSLLWVKVSAEGRTVDVARLRPSDDAEFERAVRNFVWSVTWHPALKGGVPVEAWTQMLFPPAPQ
jgi:hypothetical protein